MSRSCRVKCLYLNTSILIRSVNPREHGHRDAWAFLRECCKLCSCIYSSVHGLEPWRPGTRERVSRLLDEIGAVKVDVNLESVVRRAEELRREWGVSRKRLIDIAHMLVASEVCGAIAAVDRFIRSRSKVLGLLYVNHYTGCPVA